jgi:hypothetical protein
VFQPAVDGLGRTVAGAWAVEVGQHVSGAAMEGPPEGRRSRSGRSFSSRAVACGSPVAGPPGAGGDPAILRRRMPPASTWIAVCASQLGPKSSMVGQSSGGIGATRCCGDPRPPHARTARGRPSNASARPTRRR